MAVPQERSNYSFADYLAWDEDSRIEILDGQMILMAPPSRIHQEISVELTRQFANFLEGKKCKVYHAPFAVRPFEKQGDRPEDVQTVFEPDITIICDPSKLDDKGCQGAPDMVVEILSPSTMRHDWLFKMHRYEQAGIKEYWIISPKEQTVQVFTLKDGRYQIQAAYTSQDIAKVTVLDGCFIELSRVFPDE